MNQEVQKVINELKAAEQAVIDKQHELLAVAQKEVRRILKRNEGQVWDAYVFVGKLPSGYARIQLTYDLNDYTKKGDW